MSTRTGSIAVGQTKTCTITNNDIQPKLIVIKHVINDDGGTKTAANFTMNVTANSPGLTTTPSETTGRIGDTDSAPREDCERARPTGTGGF